jgi:hypothetical protein
MPPIKCPTGRNRGGARQRCRSAGCASSWSPSSDRRYDAPASRVADLEQLEHAAAAFTTTRSFLCDLTLDPALIDKRPGGAADA